jgi:hypothetical protein
MQFKALQKSTKIILLIQCLCMLIGASTHFIWIIQNGWFLFRTGTPCFSIIFWDSLAVLDLIAAGLILYKPKAGIFTTLFIIVIDVVHNNLLVFLKQQHIDSIGLWNWFATYHMLVCQLLFLVFVLFTLKKCLTETGKN